MPMQSWVISAPTPGQGAGAAYANSSAATDVSAAPQFMSQTYGPMYVGQRWRWTATAIASNTGTPTLNLGFYYGGVAGTALATSGAITTTTAMSSWWWKWEAYSEVIALGSSGTIRTYGFIYIPTSSTAVTVQQLSATTQDVTANTTTNSALTAGATWGTASSSNTLTLKEFFIEQMN
jgi:hypothetical protein